MSNFLPKRLDVWVLLGIALLVPGAVSDPQVQLERNRKILHGLSVHERLRLLENFKRFQQMPREQKQKLRKLHTDLQVLNDETRKPLEELMVRYLGWLDTLSPQDRQRLNAIADSHEKIKEIEKLVSEQRSLLQRELEPLKRFYMDEASQLERQRRRLEGERTRDKAVEQLLRDLERKLTPEEKSWFASQDEESSRFRKPTVAVLLARKYNVPLPRGLHDFERFAIYSFGSLDFLTKDFKFNKDRKQDDTRKWRFPPGLDDVEDEDYDRALKVYLQFLMLPRVPEEKLLVVYENLEQLERPTIQQQFDWMVKQLLTAEYYRSNPDKLPEELRQVLLNRHRGSVGPGPGRNTASPPPSPPQRKDANERERERPRARRAATES